MEQKDNIVLKDEQLEKAKEASIKTLAVFGLLALLGLLSILIIRITPSFFGTLSSVSLSSIFSPSSTATLPVSSDKTTVNSGEIFTLTWQGGADGSYTLSYPCQAGMHLEAVLPTKNDIVYCNTAYHFMSSQNQISLVPLISDQGALGTTVPVSIHFTKNGDTKESSVGVSNITIAQSSIASASDTTSTVTNATAVSSTNTNTNSNYSSPSGGAAVKSSSSSTGSSSNNSRNSSSNVTTKNNSAGYTAGPETSHTYQYGTTSNSVVVVNNPNGYIDLTAKVLDTGIMTVNGTTSQFVSKAKINPTDRAAIKFEVFNQGTKRSPDWSFAVVLPTFPQYTFLSDAQLPLNPGDRIVYTIAFDNIIKQDEDQFTINVDNLGSVNESNKDNNIIRGKIYVNTQ